MPFVPWGDIKYGDIVTVIVGNSPRATKPIQDIVTLEAIRNVEMSAMGRFYVTPEGEARYESRYGRNP